MKKALPIGVSDFGDMITGNGYYADKTLMIEEWLQTMNGNVTLITRPRRFGKTLNMTMLR
ncbi:MAG: AAA family ATPase, partial [Peptococcaceae bacterium]